MGGTELYTQSLAQHQADAGHEVAVFYPSTQAQEGNGRYVPTPDLENNVHIYRVPLGKRSPSAVFRDTFHQPQLLQAWTAVLAQEKPDIVHVQHLMGVPFSLIQHLIKTQTAYTITLHDYWYGCANAQLIKNKDSTICDGPNRFATNCGECLFARAGAKKLAWLAPAVAPLIKYRNKNTRHILQHAKKIIAPTRFVRQTFGEMGLPTENMQIIPHGIQLPDKLPTQKAQNDKLNIGYVGSIAQQKGLHVLIEAVNQMPPDQVTLTLYGGLQTFPDYVAQLKKLITHPGINLAGRLPRADLWEKMANFNVAVLPTLWYEVSPLTIQEFFAVGVPIIASRIGAMPEKIDEGKDGLLFTPGSSVELRLLLESLLKQPEKLEHLQNGIGAVYSLGEHAEAVTAVYQQILQTAASAL